MTAFAHDVPGTPAERWREHPRWGAVAPSSLATADGTAARALVVVAAHPDDESLGAGGVLALAQAAGIPTRVVVLTDGEASHPGSSTHSRPTLGARRRREATDAVHLLAPSAHVEHLGISDGRMGEGKGRATARLVSLIGDGRHTLLVAPWRRDGHPDHEAAGEASATAAARTAATLWEYPIWFWHWAGPQEAPWDSFVAVSLAPDHRERKRRAVETHRTQVAPLSDRVGDEALLSPGFLAHFDDDRELFVLGGEPLAGRGEDEALDELHRDGGEPWGADSRWYEQRKRALLLACLPSSSSRRALEIGCSTGVLARDLAPRCDELLAVDASLAALRSAAERLADVEGTRVEQHDVPRSWPDGRFDLVVLSEVGYFLSHRALDELVERVRGCLSTDGCVALCHWRHEVVGWPLDGPAVHERFRGAGLGREIACYRDRDVEILVLAPRAGTPAADE